MEKHGYIPKGETFTLASYEEAAKKKKRGKKNAGHYRACEEYIADALSRSKTKVEVASDLLMAKNIRHLTIPEFVDETFRFQGAFSSVKKCTLKNARIIIFYFFIIYFINSEPSAYCPFEVGDGAIWDHRG